MNLLGQLSGGIFQRSGVLVCTLVIAGFMSLSGSMALGETEGAPLAVSSTHIEQAVWKAFSPDSLAHTDEYTVELPPFPEPVSVTVKGDALFVDFPESILSHIGELYLRELFHHISEAIPDYNAISQINLTCKGKHLSEYLPPTVSYGEAPAPVFRPLSPGTGLAGRNISIGPSHGRYWNGSGWFWQRSDPCGAGEAVLEDTNSIRLMQYLHQYLAQDGAVVHVPRQMDESDCCHDATGLPWWKMAARYWLQHQGLPSWVWDSSTTDYNDDIRARPLYADFRGSDIYISHHTNAGGGGTGTGTETYRDSKMEKTAHIANSLSLANAVHNSIISHIRNTYDAGWANRGVKDSAGAFGEIRIPNRPAILIELAFHDNCSKDVQYLTDDFFRSLSQWAIYKGVCDYFGVTPTWDKYSCELVSDSIPDTMIAGESYQVSVTYRNRGVLWQDARSFRLGAVGDSDPFTAFNRVSLSGSIRPGQEHTFNFTMTAPQAAGTYTTDWRMVRDGVSWFGPTLTKQVVVNPNTPDTEPPSIPQNLLAVSAGPNVIQLYWSPSTDNVGVANYEVRRDGILLAAPETPRYTDKAVAVNRTYSYEVRARDMAGNFSGWSTPSEATTLSGQSLIFFEGFNGNLDRWTQGPFPFDYSEAQNKGIYPGAGAAYNSPGNSSQMFYQFPRPFAQAIVSGWFYDPFGGFKSGTCGTSFRQSLSLRAHDGSASLIIDNCTASNVAANSYFHRTVGTGGLPYTAFGIRNPNPNCTGDWIYFETRVTPELVGASPAGSIQVMAADAGGIHIGTPPLQTSFFDHGIGRITLGLGVSSVGESWWDDITFWATPPLAPVPGTPVSASTTSITWQFAPGDANHFGFDVTNNSGTVLSPAWPETGWLRRSATSWQESGLEANTSYQRRIRAWNGILNSPLTGLVTGWTLSVPPSAGTVTGTRQPGIVYDTPEFGFNAVGGFGAGRVQYYRYAWNTVSSPPAQWDALQEWSSGTLNVSAAHNGLWYLHVQGYNGADIPNGVYTLGPYIFQGEELGTVVVTDEGVWTPSLTTLRATWAYSGNVSALNRFEYAIGTTPELQNVRNWQSVGLAQAMEDAGLSLTDNTTYFIQVRPVDLLGQSGEAGVSDGITVAPNAGSIGQALHLADGVGLRLTGKLVTGTRPGSFWIQELDRSAGIRVVSGQVFASGDTVNAAGILGLFGQERALFADVVDLASSGSALPLPLGMIGRTLGGQGFNPFTPGADQSIGLYNVGLLVRVWGVVTGSDSSDPENRFFLLDDGTAPGRPVKVLTGSVTPPSGGFVQVTGIVSLQNVGGLRRPILVVRTAGDILTIP